METVTIQFLKQDIIPLIDMLMFNIYELKEREAFSDESLDISGALELYNEQLNKLKPIVKELDPVNYVFLDLCEWDYEKHRDYDSSLGFDMEG